MSDSRTVSHLGADRLAVEIRGRTVTVDQPIEAGGDDTGELTSGPSCQGFGP